MPYQLKPGEGPEDAAQALLGDRRLVSEIRLVHGTAYLLDERAGPPSDWAAKPPSNFNREQRAGRNPEAEA